MRHRSRHEKKMTERGGGVAIPHTASERKDAAIMQAMTTMRSEKVKKRKEKEASKRAEREVKAAREAMKKKEAMKPLKKRMYREIQFAEDRATKKGKH